MKILVVDDEELLVKGIRFNLQNEGYEVLTGSNGVEAVEKAREHSPDLIILDIMMPEMDGTEVLKNLRSNAKHKDIPVIMATAKGTEMDKIIGLNSGADDYLVKPFGVMEMVARVNAVLRRTKKDVSSQALTVGGILLKEQEHMVLDTHRSIGTEETTGKGDL